MTLRRALYRVARQALQRPADAHHLSAQYLSEIRSNNPQVLAEKYLKQVLECAQTKVPYYRKLSAGSHLSQYPILTRQILRDEFENLKTTGYQAPGMYVNKTGGSTGMPVGVLQDWSYEEWIHASEQYFYENFLGVSYDTTRKIVLWGSPRDASFQQTLKGKISNWFHHSLFLNAFNIPAHQWRYYIELINSYRPVFIKAYSGSLYALACYAKKHNLKLCSPRVIYTSAEKLHEHMRAQIEEVFQAPVFDFYGCREVGAIAAQCKHKNYHIFSFNNVLEILERDQETPASAGTAGRIVLTNLHNQAMPMIRYDVGDIGRLSNLTCSCGINLPLLDSIEGKALDYFELLDGRLVHPCEILLPLKAQDWVQEFQGLQLDKNKFEIRVVPRAPQATEQIESLKNQILKILGTEAQLEVRIVDKIELSPQGKLSYMKNLMRAEKAN